MRIIKVKFSKVKKYEAMPGFVYCGRSFGGFAGSAFANPYSTGNRTADIASYAAHVDEAIRIVGPLRQAILDLPDDAMLGCWCCDKDNAGTKPWLCHCDVIAAAKIRLVNEMSGVPAANLRRD